MDTKSNKSRPISPVRVVTTEEMIALSRVNMDEQSIKPVTYTPYVNPHVDSTTSKSKN